MNFYFEMAINILEVTLILSFLVQYFGYRIKYPAKYIWTIIIGLVSFCNIAFFSWNNLYESYASSLQILMFCYAVHYSKKYLYLHLLWDL